MAMIAMLCQVQPVLDGFLSTELIQTLLEMGKAKTF